jgi:hypothetical protein
MYVITLGIRMLCSIAWPPTNQSDWREWCGPCEEDIETKDSESGNNTVILGFGIVHPLKYYTPEDAQRTIDRYNISDAQVAAWRN